MIEQDVGVESVRVTFSLPVSEGEVSVVGSFNDWDPEAHRLSGEESLQSVTVELSPGRYEFRYLGPNGRWLDDPDADAYEAGNSVILVEVLEDAPAERADGEAPEQEGSPD